MGGRAIESADYRGIRTDEDLLNALPEVLERVGKTANTHLSMLYGPESGGPSKRLHEDALQSYLQCRLHDMLRDRVLDSGTTVIADREDLAAYNKRLDVKVRAPRLGGGYATVVIEVKWSDNEEVSTALDEQLGHYLRENDGLSCGIYMVGCSGTLGTWHRRAGHRARPATKGWLLEKLVEQAAGFADTNADMQIEPFVMYLAWPI